jgi:threonine/homoserine/homoserine lactone efflux protein
MENIFQSLLIGISIAAIPGPIFFELVRRTLTNGFWGGALLSVGEFLGNFFLLTIIFFGLYSFLNNSLFQMCLYLLGSIILIWLGIVAIKIKEKDIDHQYNKEKYLQNSLLVGFSISISSPIVIALWLSLSGSYLSNLNSPLLALINIFFINFGFILFFFSFASIIHFTRKKIPSKYVFLLSKIFGLVLIAYGNSFLYKFFTSVESVF